MQTRFWWGNFRERDHYDDLGINDRIIVRVKWIFKKWAGGVDRFGLALDRDRWQALVNAIINLQSSVKHGEFCLLRTSELLKDSAPFGWLVGRSVGWSDRKNAHKM